MVDCIGDADNQSKQQAVRTIFDRALKWLVVREYGFNELVNRLQRYRYCDEDILAAVTLLRDQDLQSDDRFTEAYVHSRLEKGFGPLRITQELRNKGISGDLIAVWVDILNDKWMQQLHRVRERKYGDALPTNYQDKMRQCQFLQYRGFSSEQIQQLFRMNE